mgnify:FL=1
MPRPENSARICSIARREGPGQAPVSPFPAWPAAFRPPGSVTVLGIAARNGIMLVSHWRHLESQEGQQFGRELVMRGAEERLAPILMTALATALALL